jgi:ABC-2 type transport system ATP-binding protein
LKDTLLEVTGLSKSFGSLKAVNNISLTVERGEVLGFLGPNGAGKSTTMKMITGFLTPSEGNICVAGCNIEEMPLLAKSRIGYLPEGAPAYGEMTPVTFLNFIADVRNIPREHKKARINEVMEKIHLKQVANQPIETLSKGYKRRVGIAQAIIHDPEILIMDEPTDGLDPNQKHEIRQLIKEMATEKAILISTHILEEVDSVCTRAIIIARGEVIFSGTPLELASQSSYHNAVTIMVDTGLETEVQRILKEVEVIKHFEITTQKDFTRMTMKPAAGVNDLRQRIQKKLDSTDYAIHQLYIEEGRLDEVFRTMTREHESGSIHRT